MQKIKSERYLVIGSDGAVGSNYAAFLKGRGQKVVGTTRGNVREDGKVFLDLTGFSFADLDQFNDFDHVFICAGNTNILECELSPSETRKINVDALLRIAEKLSGEDTRIYFLSSNTVFSGIEEVDEYSSYSPANEYGRQKAEVEEALLEMKNSVVIRLSKVVSPGVGVFSSFISSLQNGEPVQAFDDLLICPVSIGYVCESMYRIASSNKTGIFHLSGNQDVSYAEVARGIARCLSVPEKLVSPVSCKNGGTQVFFQPAHAGLGMVRTRQLLGIEPESLGHVIGGLVKV